MTEDTLGMIGTTFVEAVHVELANEGVHFGVAEVAGEDDGLKFVDVFDDELSSGRGPVGNLGKLFILTKMAFTFKISKVLDINPATSVVSCSSY